MAVAIINSRRVHLKNCMFWNDYSWRIRRDQLKSFPWCCNVIYLLQTDKQLINKISNRNNYWTRVLHSYSLCCDVTREVETPWVRCALSRIVLRCVGTVQQSRSLDRVCSIPFHSPTLQVGGNSTSSKKVMAEVEMLWFPHLLNIAVCKITPKALFSAWILWWWYITCRRTIQIAIL